MQKKKVGEVKDWLLAAHGPGLLLLSGPPGCGKTTTVKTLAHELGIEVTEWTTPTPVLWAEHLQQRAAGIPGPYSSKLDDFEDFVSHAKLSTLPLQLSQAPATPASGATQRFTIGRLKAPHGNHAFATEQQSLSQTALQPGISARKLLLIEDMPHYADGHQRQRLADLLGSIARLPKCRVVIMATASTAQGPQDRSSAVTASQGLHKDIAAAIDAAGATHITFNPVTKPNIEKALKTIAGATGLQLDADLLSRTADGASGDLRNAVEALQLAAAGVPLNAKAAHNHKSKARRAKKGKTEAKLPTVAASHQSFGKDTGLALFHALGKILYNKRLDPSIDGVDNPAEGLELGQRQLPANSQAVLMPCSSRECGVADRHKRPRTAVDPEVVLLKSGLDAATAAAFLHENMLEFVDNEAMEEAAQAYTYLSHSAWMVDHASTQAPDWSSEDVAGHSLIEAAAGSVTMRGLLYSLMQPAARRFLSLKSPALFTTNKAALLNKAELQRMCWLSDSMTGSSRVVAADSLPFARRMSTTSYRADLHAVLPRQWQHVHNGEMQLQSLWDHKLQGDSYEVAAGTAALSSLRFGELSDDAIEDND